MKRELRKEIEMIVVWVDEGFFEVQFYFCNGLAAGLANCYESSEALRNTFQGDFTGEIIKGKKFVYNLNATDKLNIVAEYKKNRIEVRFAFQVGYESENESSGSLLFQLEPIEFENLFSEYSHFNGVVGENASWTAESN
ncbi:MAG: hypothetical protein H6611_10225 [Ignavibacteriales bacterium]|nr:hypothetical protein [Ignavibacteriales bacterium]